MNVCIYIYTQMLIFVYTFLDVGWTHATPNGYQKLRVKWHGDTYSVKGASHLPFQKKCMHSYTYIYSYIIYNYTFY